MNKNIELLIRKNNATVSSETFRSSIKQAERIGVAKLSNFGKGFGMVVKNNGNHVAGWENNGDRLLPVNPCSI